MAELPTGKIAKAGGEPMAVQEDRVAQPDNIDMTTAKQDSDHIPSDGKEGKSATVDDDDEASPINGHRKVSSGSGEGGTASDNAASGAEEPANANANANADADGTADEVEKLHLNADDAPKKKKKRSKKKGGANKKNVTGFEEYYADAPMTADEAAKERKEIYDCTRTLSDRIEECIQRYRARRRLDNERTNMFDKYLFLGGIDTSPRQFTGMALDFDAIKEADSEEVRRMTATDYVGQAGIRFYDPHEDADNWEVDFAAIAKGFLSRTITEMYSYDLEAIQKAADVIKNFLNYVMMHDVCPEYTADILAARNICEIAPAEMRFVHDLTLVLPGTFNTAARALFCDGKVNDLSTDENLKAWFNFRLTVLLWGQTSKGPIVEAKQLEDATSVQVIDTKEETYEVTEVHRPRRKEIKLVEGQLEAAGHKDKLLPAGILTLRPSVIEHGYDNVPRLDELDLSDAPTEDYLLEDELLAKVERGMKLCLVVCKLDIGVRFVKEVYDLRVSFDTFLPQHLMARFKDPVPNDRPPPSVENPDAEEKALGAVDDD